MIKKIFQLPSQEKRERHLTNFTGCLVSFQLTVFVKMKILIVCVLGLAVCLGNATEEKRNARKQQLLLLGTHEGDFPKHFKRKTHRRFWSRGCSLVAIIPEIILQHIEGVCLPTYNSSFSCGIIIKRN